MQTATTPELVDDGRPWNGLAEWPDATAGSLNRSREVDYEGLNRTLARYFEDPALVQGAKTRAIVVIYKASAEAPHCTSSFACSVLVSCFQVHQDNRWHSEGIGCCNKRQNLLYQFRWQSPPTWHSNGAPSCHAQHPVVLLSCLLQCCIPM